MLPKLLRKVIRFSKLNPTRMKYLTVFFHILWPLLTQLLYLKRLVIQVISWDTFVVNRRFLPSLFQFFRSFPWYLREIFIFFFKNTKRITHFHHQFLTGFHVTLCLNFYPFSKQEFTFKISVQFSHQYLYPDSLSRSLVPI